MSSPNNRTPVLGSPFFALSPFAFFLIFILGISLYAQDFYAVPTLVGFVVTAIYCFFLYANRGLKQNIKDFCSAAGDVNIITMILIFLLAGSFGALAQDIGAIDATVQLFLSCITDHLLLPCVFVTCCFISMAMGSSMGTVSILSPIALGLTDGASIEPAVVLAAVIGGAMFGDNLSSISDTTIAAVSSQQCQMNEKFKQNFLIVFPAAILVFLIYCFVPVHLKSTMTPKEVSLWKILPYFLIILGAISKINVFILLLSGNVSCLFLAFFVEGRDAMTLMRTIHQGFVSMEDLAVLSLIAAGTAGLVRANGGMEYILKRIQARCQSGRGAECGIAILALLTNLFTANNTVAIVISGPIAKRIAERYQISRRKSASLLDIFTSSIQGMLPYGAQVLTAVSFAKIAPTALLPYNYYPILTLLMGLLSIQFRSFFTKN